MNRISLEFEERKKEIDSYFSLLRIVEFGACTVTSVSIDGQTTSCQINSDLSKILKANGFILLYNLVESTVRKSIEIILDTLYSERISYQNMTEQLKKLWISHHTLPLKKGANAFNYDKIQRLMFEMANNIIINNMDRLESDCVRISGNVDAQEIRKIAAKIGFETSENGQDLLTIKEKRNHLAHGEKSFIEVGRDYSIQDLQLFKSRTYDHLEDVLLKISLYLTNENYKLKI